MLHLTGTSWLSIIFCSVLSRDVHTFQFMLIRNYYKPKREVYVFDWVYKFFLQAPSKDTGSPSPIKSKTILLNNKQ